MQDSQDFVIRATTFDDILNMRKMHAQSWRETYESLEHGVTKEWLEKRTSAWTSPEGVERSREHFKEVFGHPNHLHEVAVDGKGKVIGVVHVSRGEEGQHLQALYLDKSHHGTGLAQVLMDRAIAWCDRPQPIYLEVATYNERAKAFYRKYHFREVNGTEEYFAELIPTIRMERKGETV